MYDPRQVARMGVNYISNLTPTMHTRRGMDYPAVINALELPVQMESYDLINKARVFSQSCRL